MKNSSKVSSIIIFNLLFIHIGPGDFVLADEIIARIETDKVTVDITSPESGVIKQYFSAEGDTVDVGADFFEIDTDAVAPAASAAPTTPEPAAAATP